MRGQAGIQGRGRSRLLAPALKVAVGSPLFVVGLASLPVPVPPPPAPLFVQAGAGVLPTPAIGLPTPSAPSLVAVSPPVAGAGAGAVSSPATSTPPAQPGGAVHPRQATAGGRAPAAAATTRGPGLRLPFTAIVINSPVDVALLGAVACLPLLFVIWLFAFGRTFVEARRAREAHLRLMLAADLGLRPRDLGRISTSALFGLREKAAFDELTGVLRRAAGIAAAQRAVASARRRGSPLSVVFLDVDGLKQANDRHGRAAGDRLLKSLAELVRRGLRDQDMLFRYGGDEFVCVLPDTGGRAAREKLEGIQRAAAKSGIRFCTGVAELERHDDVLSMFGRADKDLYDFKAKRGAIVPLPLAGPSPGAVASPRRRQRGY